MRGDSRRWRPGLEDQSFLWNPSMEQALEAFFWKSVLRIALPC
jgi:hypothetical protein